MYLCSSKRFLRKIFNNRRTKIHFLACFCIVVSFGFLIIGKKRLRPPHHHQVHSRTTQSDKSSAMIERIDTKNRVCRYLNEVHPKDIASSTNRLNSLVYVEKHNFIWCPVPKAASTLWIENLFNIAAIDEARKSALRKEEKFYSKIKDVADNVIDSALVLNEVQRRKSTVKKFVIVRHPFERLVSAFRDKLERYHGDHLDDDYYYKNYGKDIVHKFRERALNIYGPDFFEDQRYSATFGNVSNRKPEMPIFWEFVQFVLSNPRNRDLDPHWSPVYKLCSMCDIDMDFILKLESINQEEALLEDFLGLEDLPKVNKFNANSLIPGMNSLEITRTYFDSLSEEDVEGLYQAYKFDFIMFNYTFKWKDELYYPLKCDIDFTDCTESH